VESKAKEDKRAIDAMKSFELNHTCPLCKTKADYFCSFGKKRRDYFKCKHCDAVFLHPNNYIDYNQEKERYETHNNDVTDKRYQNFVRPITEAVKQTFPLTANGLDYGCGTGPVASFVLESKGFKKITLYDPFFQPSEEHLTQRYDFIICCEVIEHFFSPKEEFLRLRNLLKPNGKLFCKTSILKTDCHETYFQDWWYKNDPTHVFFYTSKTLEYIRVQFGFKTLSIETDLITFSLI